MTETVPELLAELGHTRPVLERLAAYEERLFLVKAGALTTVEAIGSLARACPGSGPLVVVVDYLQKVSVYPDPPSEEEQVRRSVEGLKELAMSQSVAVLAVVAADAEGNMVSFINSNYDYFGSGIVVRTRRLLT